jgi:hypothetical protein
MTPDGVTRFYRLAWGVRFVFLKGDAGPCRKVGIRWYVREADGVELLVKTTHVGVRPLEADATPRDTPA